MGTHPIFESDFDCLTECLEVVLPKPDSLPSENFLIRWLLKEKVVEKEVMTFLADFSKTELSV